MSLAAPADNLRSPLRLTAVSVGVSLAAAALLVAFSAHGSGDYSLWHQASGDNAAPALQVLARGQLSGYADQQPMMGLGSVLLRVPVLVAGRTFGLGDFTDYRVGAFVCLLAAALLLTALLTAAVRTPRLARAGTLRSWRPAAAAGAGAVLVISPASLDAVAAGHPEEILCAAAATAAVLAAAGGRVRLSSLLLGLALGTKEWGAIAVLPVLVALPARRREALGLAAVTAAALVLPPIALDPAAFARAGQALGDSHLVSALSAWWPLAEPSRAFHAAPLAGTLPWGLTKSAALALPLGVATALAAFATVLARRSPRRPEPLALLALLGLMRCVVDPAPDEYYCLAFLAPLLARDVLKPEGAPMASALGFLAVWLVFGPLAPGSPGTLNAVVMGVAAAALTGLTLGAFVPRAGRSSAVRHPPIEVKCGV